MREIKFRAWDEFHGLMEYNVNVNRGKPVKQGYQWFNAENTVHDSELMQFTGLKDKNGKEIYEGDVLENSEDVRGVLRYVTKHAGLLIHCFLDEQYYYIGHAHKYKVLGNIYENPELLKEG